MPLCCDKPADERLMCLLAYTDRTITIAAPILEGKLMIRINTVTDLGLFNSAKNALKCNLFGMKF